MTAMENTAKDKRIGANTFPCEGCGSQMHFDPDTQGMKCDHCGRSDALDLQWMESPEYLYNPADGGYTAPDWELLGNRTVSCRNCGAQTVIAADEMTAECPFCGSRYVVDSGEVDVGILPESLMPFRISRDKAVEIFKGWVKKRFWAPGKYKKSRAAVEHLQGVYMPYWTFDSDLVSDYAGEGGKDYTVTRTRVVNGKRQTYTETRTRWYPISGREQLAFDDYPACATRTLDQQLIRQLGGYSMKVLCRYAPAFLAGFSAERYNVGLDEGWSAVSPAMEAAMESRIQANEGYDHYRGMRYNHQFYNVRFKHILLPVWIFSSPYGKKIYRFMINGETGRVAGSAPVSPFKVLAAVAAGLALVLLIFLLLYYM